MGVFYRCMVWGSAEDLADEGRNIFYGGGSARGVVLGRRCGVSLVGSEHGPLDRYGRLP